MLIDGVWQYLESWSSVGYLWLCEQYVYFEYSSPLHLTPSNSVLSYEDIRLLRDFAAHGVLFPRKHSGGWSCALVSVKPLSTEGAHVTVKAGISMLLPTRRGLRILQLL